MIIWRRVWMVAGSLVAAAGLYYALQPTPPEEVLLRFLKQEYLRAKEVTMYSLDPSSSYTRPEGEAPEVEQFWGCDVLGKVTLTNFRDREDGMLGVAEALESRDMSWYAACLFAPRHAFRIVTHDGQTVTFALCYECSQAKFEGLPAKYAGCKIGDGGHELLNALLDKYKLPRDIPN